MAIVSTTIAKRETQPTFYWAIEGYDSTKKIFSTRVKATLFSERQLRSLLMALTAKAGLTYDEMVGAYATKRTKISNAHLTIHTDVQQHTLTCGSNPHFVARLVRSLR